ncbi:TRAP transporter small permease [Siminovitchia sediminis]|uniref:TRAP transporter small permease n=1 Tax=Siminovitchia sediminis TaxID=1274353 RepID=A0ABW4KGA8_9BACI
MVKKLSRYLDVSENFFAFIAALLILFITISIILEVVFRLFFNISFSWVHELSEYTLLYLPFLTAAWLLRYNDHIVIDLIEPILSPRVKYVLDIIIILIGIFVSVILVWFGFITVADYFSSGLRSQTTLKIPKGYIAIIIPLGSVLLLFEFIRILYRKVFSAQNLAGNGEEGGI